MKNFDQLMTEVSPLKVSAFLYCQPFSSDQKKKIINLNLKTSALQIEDHSNPLYR